MMKQNSMMVAGNYDKEDNLRKVLLQTWNILLMTMLGLCWQSTTSWSIPLILSLKSFEPSRPEICLMYSVLSAILCV